jgi:signal peptidase I
MASRDATDDAEPKDRGHFETVKALLLAVVLALGIRSFLFEPFKIPSGSMIPTLLVGDYIVVNKFSYGVRLPITGTLLIPVGEPERGDIVVFRFPDDPSTDYIKRVVGVPGDRVEVQRGRLFLNGQPVDRVDEGKFSYLDYQQHREVTRARYREINADGVEYTIIHDARSARIGSRRHWVVPEGKYFMMGDNRDNSRDSRLWTQPFVSSHQLKGRAMFVHWSWVVSSGPGHNRGFVMDFLHTLYRVFTFQVEEMRWDRIGHSIDGVADGAREPRD